MQKFSRVPLFLLPLLALLVLLILLVVLVLLVLLILMEGLIPLRLFVPRTSSCTSRRELAASRLSKLSVLRISTCAARSVVV